MNAEELIIYIKECVNALGIQEYEPIITPTTGDPTELQNDVTIIIMEQVGDDTKPKFRIDVKDLEALRYNLKNISSKNMPSEFNDIVNDNFDKLI